jgi:hypothetical protein
MARLTARSCVALVVYALMLLLVSGRSLVSAHHPSRADLRKAKRKHDAMKGSHSSSSKDKSSSSSKHSSKSDKVRACVFWGCLTA